MTGCAEIFLAAFLLIDLWFAAASRLLHCIRLVAYQGILIGLLPLVLWDWRSVPRAELLLIAALGILVKGFLLPYLLKKAMFRAKVKRELEPLVGYSASLGIVLAAAGVAFWFCMKYNIAPESAPMMSTPVALSTMMTGLFIIVARRKAITQAIGFLIFENGITIFGLGMTVENGLIVELGILLDVFVLVFVMGIAVFQIRREFSHIDADRLHDLNDAPEKNEKSAVKGDF